MAESARGIYFSTETTKTPHYSHYAFSAQVHVRLTFYSREFYTFGILMQKLEKNILCKFLNLSRELNWLAAI